jgi:hypothetical protein
LPQAICRKFLPPNPLWQGQQTRGRGHGKGLEDFLMATLSCSDCGKPDVHLTDFFLVPDKVWDALCPLDAILCLGCFGKRLNPANPPDKEGLSAEIRRQRKRFKLKNFNQWLGEKRDGEEYRGCYLVLFHVEPKAAERAAKLDQELLKKVMTSKRVHERNAAATLHASLIAAIAATQVAVGASIGKRGLIPFGKNPTALQITTS